jgi:eukaryotic-like serine/threonine-protein kinase
MASQKFTLRELFDMAFGLPEDERARFLDTHCADAAERHHLERMLAYDTNPAGTLPKVPASALANALSDADVIPVLPTGSRIGPFELIAVLGEGGSSTVFHAARTSEGVRQDVALKLLRRGLYSDEARRQFRRERLALAQLQHPGIARLIEGGVTETGVAYIALELVRGEPITHYARDHRLDMRARLRLFLDVCRAVDAAHRALIVHRDLKPSNVLITTDGSVKLLDFGIAKLLSADDDTHTQMPAFTPAYASPEQRAAGLITTATDVYGLGVLLGELMTGERLNEASTRTPSNSISELHDAGVLPAAPAVTRRQLRGDLDNIVLKALDADPARRYASAGMLAEDIERLIDGRPVGAHPQSTWYRASKFVGRHRGGVAITVIFVLGILAAFGVALWQAEVARQEAQRASDVRAFLESLFDPVRKGVSQDKLPTIRDLVAAGVARLKENTNLDPRERVDLTLLFTDLTDSLGDRSGARELAASADQLADVSFAKSDPMAIDALTKRAALAIRSGDFATGEPALLDAEHRLRDAGIHGMALIDVLDNRAFIEMNRDHTEASLALERQALDERVRAFGANAEEAGAGYDNLGFGLEGTGQFDAAAAAYERAYQIDLNYRQADSYDVLDDVSNLGSTLLRAGHVHRARERLAQAQDGLDKIGGKPRSLNILNPQKLCSADTMLFDVAAAEKSCAHMLDIAAQVTGQTSVAYADPLRVWAAYLLDTGALSQARADVQRAWQLYPDTPEYQSRRGALLRMRADLDWFDGDIVKARDDAIAARHLVATVPDLPARISLDGLLALACARAPASSCPAGLDDLLAAELKQNAANPHPRMLLAWIALARRDMDRADALSARKAIDSGIDAARAELNQEHPLMQAARMWQVITLDAAHACAEVRSARAGVDNAAMGDKYPWRLEAAAELAHASHCDESKGDVFGKHQ